MCSSQSAIAAAGRSASPDVVVQSVRSGERHVVIRGGSTARFVRTGHILYFSDGGLFGVPFDERRLETAGERIPLIDDVTSSRRDSPAFDVSENGSLIYIAGASRTGGLAMIERHGSVTSLPVKAAVYEAPRISPDGTRVAVGTAGTHANIWMSDLRGTSSIRQLTLEGRNRFPVWSADGERVAFQSDRGGDVAIWWQRADGTQPAERLTTPDANDVHTPEAWSPRDNRLLYDTARASQHALWMLSLDDRRSSIVSDVQGSGVPIAATFSPDGRWIAYQFGSVGPGTFPSVFVRPFPLTSVKYRIADGIHPLWSPDGKELLYNQGPSRPLAAVSVTTEPVFSWGEPRSESLAICLPRRRPLVRTQHRHRSGRTVDWRRGASMRRRRRRRHQRRSRSCSTGSKNSVGWCREAVDVTRLRSPSPDGWRVSRLHRTVSRCP